MRTDGVIGSANADSFVSAGALPLAAPVSWCSRAMVLAALFILVGIVWDISWHSTIGRDTFWTPAHICIHLGGTLGGLVSGWLVLSATFGKAQPERDAKRWCSRSKGAPQARTATFRSLQCSNDFGVKSRSVCSFSGGFFSSQIQNGSQIRF
jgi:hypothetical protein